MNSLPKHACTKEGYKHKTPEETLATVHDSSDRGAALENGASHFFKIIGLNFAQIHNRTCWRDLGSREQEGLEQNHVSFSLN